MQVYGFAFGKGNVGVYTLWRLKNIDCCYQVWPNNLDSYLRFLLHDKPDFILGLGNYSGQGQDEIRIETKCTDKFRGDFIKSDKLVEIPIRSYLRPSEKSKFSQGIGNSFGNLTSWKIMELINEGKLPSQYTFLDIPNRMKTWFAVAEIDTMLETFKEQ